MYYASSENKGADQLRGYREADLRLCFRLCRLLVFPWGGSLYFSTRCNDTSRAAQQENLALDFLPRFGTNSGDVQRLKDGQGFEI